MSQAFRFFGFEDGIAWLSERRANLCCAASCNGTSRACFGGALAAAPGCIAMLAHRLPIPLPPGLPPVCSLTVRHSAGFLCQRNRLNGCSTFKPNGLAKDALLQELLTVYQEAAAACKAATDVETRQVLADIKHGLNLALEHSLPLDDRSKKRWEELQAAFPDQTPG
jgi:hypothetical protein